MECNSGKPAIDIDKRRTELLELSSYIQTVDNDVTMILQSLQWDRKHLIEASPMVLCRHDRNHSIPPDKLEFHEKECYLRSLGYSKEDLLLPEPLDANASTLVTLSKNDIQNIIEYAAKVDPAFKKGRGTRTDSEPLSLERLQHAYSADERRAFHDAVVSAAPSCHNLSELALPSIDGENKNAKPKSRAEIIAELRDMKRRRTKYRGAAKTCNYSDELRSVIATQMEHYSEALGVDTKNDFTDISRHDKANDYRVQIKKEPLESEYYTTDTTEQEVRRNSSKYYDRHRDKTRDDTRHRERSKDDIRHKEKSRDDNRHKENYRNDRQSDRSRDKYTTKERVHDGYKRDRDDRRHNDRDRYSSSSKEGRDRNDRNSDKYRNYKGYKPSRNDGRYEYKHYEKYKEEKHKRYYDHREKYDVQKRIKQEKD